MRTGLANGRRRACRFAAVAIGIGFTVSSAAAESWRYVVPEPGDAHEHPPVRALSLGSEKPEDLIEKVAFRGTQQRYAQFRYGQAGSTEVVVVVDMAGRDDVDLYVDADRDYRIEARERVEPTGSPWRVALPAAVVRGDVTELIPRTVVFRLSRTARLLSYATCGYMEGRLPLDGRTVAVRRMDGDGNGLFADKEDRLWLDLDGNAVWDPLSEQFLCAAILRLGAARYAVQSDPLGTRLTLSKLEGTGSIQVALPAGGGKPRMIGLAVTLSGEDGTLVNLDQGHSAADVPIGRYRTSTVVLALADGAGGPDWHYVFSDNGARSPRPWHEVAASGSVVIDPVGSLELALLPDSGSAAWEPGETLRVQPAMYTGDGLLVAKVYRGEHSSRYSGDDCQARVELTSAEGGLLDSSHSGFA